MYHVLVPTIGESQTAGPTPAEELGRQLLRHTRLFHHLKARTTTWLPADLEWGAVALLVHLADGGARRQRDLAGCTRLDPSTVSRHVAQLVRGGLVERRPDPEDGRGVQLVATTDGLGLNDTMIEQRTALVTALVTGWDPTDVTRLAALLSRLSDEIETSLDRRDTRRTEPAPTPPREPGLSPATDHVRSTPAAPEEG